MTAGKRPLNYTTGEPAPVTAKDVQVTKLWQARCRVHACGWDGELLPTFAGANAERQAHLDHHRTLPSDPVLATAVKEWDQCRTLAARHRRACPGPGLDCDDCVSLAGHVARAEEQVTLLSHPDAATAEMF